MSQVVPLSLEAVEIEPRKYLSRPQKLLRWMQVNCACLECGKSVELDSKDTEWDHIIPLALGGSQSLLNFAPLHKTPCHAAKTKRDIRAIAKAKRLEARELGTRRPRKTIKGGGFRKDIRRRMNGKVEPR